MIGLRKNRGGNKANRSSMLVRGFEASSTTKLIQIVLDHGCFTTKDIGSLCAKETLTTYNFLCSLLSLVAKSTDSPPGSPMVVVVDASRQPVKALRLVLKACQSALGLRLRQVIIIEPEKFLDQQKLSFDILLESYPFKTTLSARHKLGRHVNVLDLADVLGGLLPGSGAWVDLRGKLEAGHAPSGTPSIGRLQQKDAAVLVHLGPPVFTGRRASKPELMSPSTSTDDDGLLEEHRATIRSLLDWLAGPGESWRRSLADVGESIDEARQLERQHGELASRTEQVVDQAAELAEAVTFLASDPDHPLRTLAAELANSVHDFRQHVLAQGRLKALCTTLHAVVADFFAESDALLKVLCDDSQQVSPEAELEAVEQRSSAVDERFSLAAEACDGVEALLGGNTRSSVEEQRAAIVERLKRGHELLDLHRLKLQQMIQLHTCETDQRQVEAWLNELAACIIGEPFRRGTTPPGLAAKLSHFEKSARSIHEYGQQLSHLSLLLRRTLRLEISPQLSACQRVDSAWNDFLRNYRRYRPLC